MCRNIGIKFISRTYTYMYKTTQEREIQDFYFEAVTLKQRIIMLVLSKSSLGNYYK